MIPKGIRTTVVELIHDKLGRNGYERFRALFEQLECSAGHSGALRHDFRVGDRYYNAAKGGQMKSATFLRIASVLTLMHAILHTIGGVFGKPMPGPAEQAVAAMKANHFILMGNTRTYWDLYMGLGLGITIFLTTEAIVFWLLASLSATVGARLRPIIAVFALGYLAFAVNSFRFFFLAPVIVEVLIVSCLTPAIFAAKKRIPEG